uniref:Uncharacterized protein n=1 Tax=Parascaris univalens TaxID=6257 RepID=A0A915ABC1_PARUN
MFISKMNSLNVTLLHRSLRYCRIMSQRPRKGISYIAALKIKYFVVYLSQIFPSFLTVLKCDCFCKGVPFDLMKNVLKNY